MQIEYEATFEDIDKDGVRKKLKDIGAKLVKPERLHKRITLNLPQGIDTKNTFVRVRDEGDQIVLTLKVIEEGKIDKQEEINLKIDDIKKAEELLIFLGCSKKAYQENKREIWKLDDVEITIDQWPFLEPIVEIEGYSEKSVIETAKKLGFDYKDALFGPITLLYKRKYNVSSDIINNKTPKITFDMKNPFL